LPVEPRNPQSLLSIVPILPVQSIARAVAFYRLLGFTADLYADPDEYAFLHRDGLEIHLRKAPDLQKENPSGIYFRVIPGTATALQTEFRAAGVQILSPLAVREWKMNEFVLSDPDSNLLRFGEPAAAQANNGQ
jgi:catechol 2,3-dioxygenase-like lactoylglutathione lyase family enzyme